MRVMVTFITIATAQNYGLIQKMGETAKDSNNNFKLPLQVVLILILCLTFWGFLAVPFVQLQVMKADTLKHWHQLPPSVIRITRDVGMPSG